MPLTDKPLPEKLKNIMSRMLLVTLTEPVVIVTGSALAACGIERANRKTMPQAKIKFALIETIMGASLRVWRKTGFWNGDIRNSAGLFRTGDELPF
jgi:hypothetical protein